MLTAKMAKHANLKFGMHDSR